MRSGQRFGIIRFGSRTDLYLPEGVRPLVAVGQTMVGGETVIAELTPMSGSFPAMTGTCFPAASAQIKRLRRRTRPRFKGLSFNRIVPNLLTLIGLCAGLTPCVSPTRAGSAELRWRSSWPAHRWAGRPARPMLKTTSRFGAELDSLADFLCFGVAPAFIAVPVVARGGGGLGSRRA